jgi:ribonuclease R
VLGYEVCEGIIRSAKRMTYTQVQAILDSGKDAATDVDKAVREEFIDYVTHFERMYQLALKLNAKRQRRGSIDFDLPEPVIEFDPDGNMESIVRSERGWAHRLIEEFMLSANECVATWIEKNAVPSIYRIHEMPDPKRILDFEETASGFGYSLGFASLPVKQMTMKADRRDVRKGGGGGRPAKTHEVAQSIPVTPQMYQRLTAKIAGKPEERILAYLMLRSLKQARYSENNEGHFALAATSYTHFTSPIRRYPDLIVHRILKDVLRDSAETWDGEVPIGTLTAAQAGVISDPDAALKRRSSALVTSAPEGSPSARQASRRAPEGQAAASPWSKRRERESVQLKDGPIPVEELHTIGEECSQSERRADEAERELMEWKKAKFMQDRIGEDFDGLIISVTKFGFFVELTDMFVEGLVPLATLTDDRYTFHENTREIIGQRSRKTYRLGQKVHVLVDRIDPVEKKIQFALMEDSFSTKSPKRKRKRA